MRPGHTDGRSHSSGPHGDLFHAARFKKAAGAAIDELIARDGVRFDDESAIDEVTEPGPAKTTTFTRDVRTYAKVQLATFHGVTPEHCTTCGAECLSCVAAKIDAKVASSTKVSRL